MYALELPDEEVEGELIDPEDVPLCETIWVARHLDIAFDGRLNTNQSVPLAVGIDTSEFVSCVATCILHSKNTWVDRARLVFDIQAVELDPLEPDVVFLGPAFTLGALDDVGMMVVQVTSLPASARVVLTFITQPEATAQQTGSISVCLVFRRQAPVRYRLRSPAPTAPSLAESG